MTKRIRTSVLLGILIISSHTLAFAANDDPEEARGGIVLTSSTRSDEFDKVTGGHPETKIEIAYYREPDSVSVPQENVAHSSPSSTRAVRQAPKPGRMSFSQMVLRVNRTK